MVRARPGDESRPRRRGLAAEPAAAAVSRPAPPKPSRRSRRRGRAGSRHDETAAANVLPAPMTTTVDDGEEPVIPRRRWDRRRLRLPVAAGFFAFLIFWNTANIRGDPLRPDFFLLADGFLHGRTWIDSSALLAPWDRIDIAGRTYFHAGPLSAILFMPLVAIWGVAAVATREGLVNSALGGLSVALCWTLVGRYGSRRLSDRLWVIALFALSTPLWWAATLGGVWHTAHLVATCVTLLALLEATGQRRAWLLGLLGGAAFLARAPTALALPFYAWLAMRPGGAPVTSLPRVTELGRGSLAMIGCLPALLFDGWYNAVRFGSPLDSGLSLAKQPAFLEPQRALGVFSLRHLSSNLDYFLWHLPTTGGNPPLVLRPDGMGLSVFITSPGLLLATKADWKDPVLRGAALTALLVLLPSLVFFGGGWYPLGFRYWLDALPFIMLPVASGARHGVGGGWKALIAFGALVSVWGMYSFMNVPIPPPQ